MADFTADSLAAAAAETLRDTPGLAEVVVWTSMFADMAGMAQRSHAVLSPAELSEAKGRAEGRVRDAFVARRVLRRALVAAHLGCGLAEVEIGTRCERCGDPRHDPPAVTSPDSRLHLSTSSAGELLAVAVAPFPVGLDVERHDRFGDRTAVEVDRATDGAWTAVSQSLPAAASPAHVWTALESLCKGLGTGLVAPTRDLAEALDRWSFIWWEPHAGSLGCVAAARPIEALSTPAVPHGRTDRRA